jgi:hypothetical protein
MLKDKPSQTIQALRQRLRRSDCCRVSSICEGEKILKKIDKMVKKY